MTTLPNFLIIGAAKSGTYTLFEHFARHPEAFMPAIKEPHYFSFGAGDNLAHVGIKGPVASCLDSRDAYVRLFANGQAARIAGESSVSYLYVPGTAERIFDFNPQMKLIVSLRNPVDRAYSSFHYAKSYGLEPLESLCEGIEAEPQRIRENCSILLRYRDLGLYSQQLLRYYDVFPREQIKVILFDDLVQNPLTVVRSLFEFMGVATDVQLDPTIRSNVTKGPNENNLLHRWINSENVVRAAIRKILPMPARRRLREFARETLFNSQPPPLDPGERSQCAQLFRCDVLELQDILGRDLKIWLN